MVFALRDRGAFSCRSVILAIMSKQWLLYGNEGSPKNIWGGSGDGSKCQRIEANGALRFRGSYQKGFSQGNRACRRRCGIAREHVMGAYYGAKRITGPLSNMWEGNDAADMINTKTIVLWASNVCQRDGGFDTRSNGREIKQLFRQHLVQAPERVKSPVPLTHYYRKASPNFGARLLSKGKSLSCWHRPTRTCGECRSRRGPRCGRNWRCTGSAPPSRGSRIACYRACPQRMVTSLPSCTTAGSMNASEIMEP